MARLTSQIDGTRVPGARLLNSEIAATARAFPAMSDTDCAAFVAILDR